MTNKKRRLKAWAVVWIGRDTFPIGRIFGVYITKKEALGHKTNHPCARQLKIISLRGAL